MTSFRAPPALLCTVNEFLQRLRQGRLLPDVTLPLSAIDDNAEGESVSSESDESVNELAPSSATVFASASTPVDFHAAESLLAHRELSVDVATKIMPVADLAVTEGSASRSIPPASKSPLAVLPWVLLPSIAAVVIGVFIMQPNTMPANNSDSPKSATGGSALPITTLTELSEAEVQAYRTAL